MKFLVPLHVASVDHVVIVNTHVSVVAVIVLPVAGLVFGFVIVMTGAVPSNVILPVISDDVFHNESR